MSLPTRHRFLPYAVWVLVHWFALGRATGNGSEASAPVVTNRFRLDRATNGWWLVDPQGNSFLEKGVGVVTRGESREQYDPENPAYAAWRYHGTPAAWAVTTADRLSRWGFNTAAGWADYSELARVVPSKLAFTPVLHLGASAGAPWWDMWDPRNLDRMERSARGQIAGFEGDQRQRVIGYFSDNELGWWNATLWKMTLEQPPASGQRQRLLDLLQSHYNADWKRLVEDFEPENADSWKDLGRGGMLYLRPGGNGIHVMRRFLGLLAARYYGLMGDYIRRFDPQALFLGDRYQSFYYPEVVAAAGHQVDALSSNLNPQWRDGSFLRCYLESLHRLSGKPVWITEFYAASRENRSGNRNDFGTYPVLPTQRERAATAGNTLRALFRLPYVVGADWFQYFDEPRHGRPDGENFNFGLVDIHDQPYEELVALFRGLDPVVERGKGRAGRLDAGSGVPVAPRDPLGGFASPDALLGWDRERGFVPTVEATALADLYIAWTPTALYLGVYSLDPVEAAYYRTAAVPKSDRALWTVRVQGGEAVQARIGAGREPLWNRPEIRVVNRSGLGHDVSNVAAMEIPVRFIEDRRLKAGDWIEVESVLTTHARAGRVVWRGRYQLRSRTGSPGR